MLEDTQWNTGYKPIIVRIHITEKFPWELLRDYQVKIVIPIEFQFKH